MWTRIGMVSLLLIAMVATLSYGGPDSAYGGAELGSIASSVLVDEFFLLDETTDVVRVKGELVHGSVRFDEQLTAWRFALSGKHQELNVVFASTVVPDPIWNPRVDVTVQGQLGRDGVFVADEVIPHSTCNIGSRANPRPVR